ncbi:hypothetical protein AAMO2058_001143600 [Amorphochlora amoebiformis]
MRCNDKVYTLFLRSSMQRERRQSSEQIAILEEKISILQISLEVQDLRIRIAIWVCNGMV